jgi:hypothetical protein
MALIEGKLRSVYDILQDSLLSKIFSDEGPIRNLRGLAGYNPAE